MKLLEVYNEDALDLLADVIEPVTKIMSDKKIKTLYKSKNRIELVKYILKNYKADVVVILATLDCVPVEEYKANIITMTKQLLELLNDKDLNSVFTLQGQIEEENVSGSASVNTEETVAE